MGVLLRFFNLSQPTMKVLFLVALALAAVMAEPEAEPAADASPEAWYDITMVVGQDITEDTEDGADTMDMVDTPDTPTDTDTTEENALLIPNPQLLPKLPLRLKLIPLPGIMVVTMDTPTDIADTTVWDTDVTLADTTDIVMDTDMATTDKGSLLVVIYQ